MIKKVRTLNVSERENIFDMLVKICKGAAVKHKCKVEFNVVSGYDSIMNDPSLHQIVTKAIVKVAQL